ncbi:hypothetical protein [Erythrobacter mangrovi]|uniref:Uncharacterized protein n=1 Tax=Erythrobacter mangrovi TaxID=2739433 RepID=A0A7D4BGH5_9SPHN|nr:hypothetical protein [Erythrobacter mangrovi]QKG71502.1 hypothetical protein HQR01_09085 [Erythrobacter mangrovi]
MNSVERIRGQMQVALVIEGHKQTGAIPNLLELASAYSIKGEPALINSSIKGWENENLLIVSRTLDGKVAAALRHDCIADALSHVLDSLGAETFKVDWSKEEILTDATNEALIVARDGWKLLTFERECAAPGKQPSDSASPLPFQITNNFTPVNNITSANPQPANSVSWAGWVGAMIGIIAIVVALWIGGKI